MRHFIDDAGIVYLSISKLTALCEFIRNEDVYLIYSGIICKANSFISIVKHKESVALFVGDIRHLAKGFTDRFVALEDLAEYYKKYKRLPFGIKKICRNRGWKFYPEPGAWLAIKNESGKILKFYKNGDCI